MKPAENQINPLLAALRKRRDELRESERLSYQLNESRARRTRFTQAINDINHEIEAHRLALKSPA